jgi:hypothetical protein
LAARASVFSHRQKQSQHSQPRRVCMHRLPACGQLAIGLHHLALLDDDRPAAGDAKSLRV